MATMLSWLLWVVLVFATTMWALVLVVATITLIVAVGSVLAKRIKGRAPRG
jgi:hypothetical protein